MTSGSHFSGHRLILLLVVTVGIWGSFAWWSVLQEKLITRPYTTQTTEIINGVTVEKPTTFNFPFFLNVVSYLACVFLAAFLQLVGGVTGLVAPFTRMDPFRSFTMGTTLALGTPFGYAAMKHLAYPVVLTGKMCKPIPTMIIGFLVYRERHPFLKVLGVVLLTVGVLGYSLLGAKKQHSSSASAADDGGVEGRATTSLLGLLLIGINLLFDGYTQSSQDALIKQSKAGPLQMMIVANGLAAFVAMVILTVAEYAPTNKIPLVNEFVMRQEFTKAMNFLMEHPASFADLANMACLGAVGQVFIFMGIANFGTLTVMGVTVSRKIGSVLVSIWMHNHSQTAAQFSCLCLIVVGILIDSYMSVMSKKKSHHGNHHHHQDHQEQQQEKLNSDSRSTATVEGRSSINANANANAVASARRSKKEN